MRIRLSGKENPHAEKRSEADVLSVHADGPMFSMRKSVTPEMVMQNARADGRFFCERKEDGLVIYHGPCA